MVPDCFLYCSRLNETHTFKHLILTFQESSVHIPNKTLSTTHASSSVIIIIKCFPTGLALSALVVFGYTLNPSGRHGTSRPRQLIEDYDNTNEKCSSIQFSRVIKLDQSGNLLKKYLLEEL